MGPISADPALPPTGGACLQTCQSTPPPTRLMQTGDDKDLTTQRTGAEGALRSHDRSTRVSVALGAPAKLYPSLVGPGGMF